jgi:lipopolysaccharide export system permease protein
LAQFVRIFGIASLVLVLVFWINQAVQVFDQLIADGQSARVFLELTALVLPSVIREILPFSSVIAVLYALAKLTGDSEVVVVRAVGVSPWRLARPVLAFGLLVGLMAGLLGHYLVPLSLERLSARQAAIAEAATARLLRPGEFVSPQDELTIYVQEVTPSGEFVGLLISDRRDPGQELLTTAKTAYLVRNAGHPQLVLIDGMLQQLDAGSGRLVVSSFSDLTYDLSPLLPGAGEGPASSRQLTTAVLLSAKEDAVAVTGKSAELLRAEAHERIAESLMPPAMMLIGLGALLLGQFNRFGLWPQVMLSVALMIMVEIVEGVVVSLVREDAALWFLVHALPVFGATVGGLLLWLSARPRRVMQEAVA